MQRAFLPAFAGLVILGALLFAGCSTYGSRAAGPGPAVKKHVFVLSNLNDNNSLDSQIAAAIKLRGYVVEYGPVTMMPDDTQVVVSYEDHWNWDFGDHLTFLELTARDRTTGQSYATAHYQAKIPTKKAVAKVIGELVDRLIADARS